MFLFFAQCSLCQPLRMCAPLYPPPHCQSACPFPAGGGRKSVQERSLFVLPGTNGEPKLLPRSPPNSRDHPPSAALPSARGCPLDLQCQEMPLRAAPLDNQPRSTPKPSHTGHVCVMVLGDAMHAHMPGHWDLSRDSLPLASTHPRRNGLDEWRSGGHCPFCPLELPKASEVLGGV